MQNKVTYSQLLKTNRSCVHQEPGMKNPFCCLSQRRKQGHKVDLWLICPRTAPQQSQPQNKASSSFLLEQPKVPQPSTQHSCPTGCKSLLQAQTHKISPALLSPAPAQPFTGFYCCKALKIHSPGCAATPPVPAQLSSHRMPGPSLDVHIQQ